MRVGQCLSCPIAAPRARPDCPKHPAAACWCRHTASRRPEIAAALFGQAAQAVAVAGQRRHRRFHFDAPSLTTSRDDQIHFHLILVPVMPEAQVGIGPAGLGHQLLDHPGFEEMAKTFTARMPVLGGDAGQCCGQTAVGKMQFGRLDESFRCVAMPGLQAPDQEQAFPDVQKVVHGFATQVQFVAQTGDVEQLAGAQCQQFQQALQGAGIPQTRHFARIPFDQRVQVSPMPSFRARGGTGGRLRESTGQDALRQVVACNRSGFQVWLQLPPQQCREEATRLPCQFRRRQRLQIKHLHASGQRVAQVRQQQQVGRAGQNEAARFAVVVHR